MSSGSCSPPSLSSSLHRERPVVSGLRLSGSPGSANSLSAGAAQAVVEASAPVAEWRRPGPTRKARLRRHHALRHQQETGGQRSRPSSSSSSERACVSSQCTVSRSPISVEELRREVISIVFKTHRTTLEPLSMPGMGGRLLEPRQDTPPALSSPVAPLLPPMVSTGLPPSASADVCILQRSVGMTNLERCLQLAMVAYVGGARLPVTCVDAAIAISEQLDIPRHSFLVHKFHPEDFLVVFVSHDLRNIALGVSFIEH
ncbi:hypothetical protein ZWY2020_052267 [Hordeum vulgare]|nr:hypothetical protein ZWY2020_052267 [Hordeum vulgare]